MATVTTGDETFEVCDEGAGPVLLLVHGFPLDHSMWRAQIDEFSEDHRVIVPDLRGFGGSDVTPGTVAMSQHADDLAGILTELHVDEPVVFCGLSMGGYIGWEFVRRHRDRLRALVVCDSRAAADTDEARTNRGRMVKSVLEHGSVIAAEAMTPKLVAESTRRDSPEIIEQLKSVMLATDPEGVAASLRGMAERADSTDLLPTIDVPTLLVCGELDEITPADEMATVAAAIPGARYERVPDAGHMAPLERPEPVNAALRSFLEGLPAS